MASARYREIADDLRRRINEGEWQPGDNLPRMTDLAAEFNVSRNAVARAVAELENDGLVWAVPRRGTIVRPAKRRRIVRGNVVKRNTRHRRPDGSENAGGYSFPAAEGNELWIHHVPATAAEEAITGRVATLLNVPEGSTALRRRRVTGPPNEPPFQISDSWIHPRGVADAPAVAEQGPGPGGWLDRLEEAGHGPIEWMEIHRGRLPDQDEAALLQIPTGLPVQEVIRVGFSAKDGAAIEVTQVVIPSDRVEDIVYLKRDRSAAWPHSQNGPDGPPVARGE
ncbi:GntR family transcriptional regulator [Actinomadura sp. HBU206391]|uniref:GntR family transcriptional regulator n=1 Tax=Actinomadura sp. HBU206391 TaxID=2731692 RepID=UPI0016504929|nr:GntR family transcriptional regulator [Actinomadura sp. HBU206391]MBC6458044.1 GntR family transcriptional regulator [Actinomadura sp. HBU206391]